jgi:hypothetical protein
MEGNGRSRIEHSDEAIAIYHVVYTHEGFEESAQVLFRLVQDAQRQQPGKRRNLFLDIDGHRNSDGGFDSDMHELQKDFVLGFLSQFLSEIHAPLFHAKNPKPQSDDIPPELTIQDKPEEDGQGGSSAGRN